MPTKTENGDAINLKDEADIINSAMSSPLILVGIYFLIEENEIVYVGQSNDINKRVGTHCSEKIKRFSKYSYVECDNSALDQLELLKFKPIYNEILPLCATSEQKLEWLRIKARLQFERESKQRLLKERDRGVTSTYWITFKDKSKPKNEQFLGVVVTTALGIESATKKIKELGVYPGGTPKITKIKGGKISGEVFDKLLSYEYLRELDVEIQVARD